MSIQVESTTWPMNISEPGMLPRQGCVSGRRGYGRPPWPRVPEAACGVSEGACMSDGGSGWRGLACGTKVGAGTRGMAAGGSRAWAWPWLGRPGGGVARARCGCPLSPHPLCYLLDLLLQCPTGAAVRRVRRSKRAKRSLPRPLGCLRRRPLCPDGQGLGNSRLAKYRIGGPPIYRRPAQ